MAVKDASALMDGPAWAVVALLERWNKKFDTRKESGRAHTRRSCRLPLNVDVIDESGEIVEQNVRIWVRSISAGGIGFVHPGPFPHDHLLVRLHPDPGVPSIRGTIVRRRETHNGFVECGVKFVGRQTAAD